MRVIELLRQYPELPVFLTLGIGFWIGRFKYKSVGLGPITGSLLVGLLLGHLFHFDVSPVAQHLLFAMFMFAIGYSAGPGFVRGVQDGGWRWIALGVTMPLIGLLTTIMLAKALNLELGYAAGLMSGSLTEGPIIGTASEAIRSLSIADAEKTRLVSQIAIADALTYIFGTLGVILMCAYIGPRVLGIDLADASRKLEDDLGIAHAEPGVTSSWSDVELRSYKIDEGRRIVGLTAREAEQTAIPAIAALQERSGSQISIIGYSSAVAFGHILLALSGTALINILALWR